MPNYVTIMTGAISPAEVPAFIERIKTWSRVALEKAMGVVADKVRDLTPRWRGGLVQSVQTEARMGGDEQAVFAQGVVARVHEFNAQWSKLPPLEAIQMWVEGKLGLSGKDADRATNAIRWKIRRHGLTLPNAEGRGQMFGRTYHLMASTNFHINTFATVLENALNVFPEGKAQGGIPISNYPSMYEMDPWGGPKGI